ncbi:DUF6088 family protein [Geitlerinema splendidum]|nr:DUF6088 family protein [Geitlerinema splendidum]
MSAVTRVKKFAQSNAGALLRVADFPGASPVAVSKALSRLESAGQLERVSKGLYYVPKQTLLGRSRPATYAVAFKALPGRVRPRGVTAAAMLGLTTQVAAKPQLVVYGQSTLCESGLDVLRRKAKLTSSVNISLRDAALLEVLRDCGRYSELDDDQTLSRVRDALLPRRAHGTNENVAESRSLSGRFSRLFPEKDERSDLDDAQRLRQLVECALSEPPRVRALLGALLEDLNLPSRFWKLLRDSLNPLTRFDFGPFRALPNAKEWQSK